MPQKTLDGLMLKFVATVVECLPRELTETTMQAWVENRSALQKNLSFLTPSPGHAKFRPWKESAVGVCKSFDTWRHVLKDARVRIDGISVDKEGMNPSKSIDKGFDPAPQPRIVRYVRATPIMLRAPARSENPFLMFMAQKQEFGLASLNVEDVLALAAVSQDLSRGEVLPIAMSQFIMQDTATILRIGRTREGIRFIDEVSQSLTEPLDPERAWVFQLADQ